MKSKKSSGLLDLDRDLPTNAADIAALRQARRDGNVDLRTYLDFLSSFQVSSKAGLRARKRPAGSKPFEF
jgi:hypothetical protein